MRLAIEAARQAEAHDDVPIGAVIARGGEVLAVAGNRREKDRDPTAHAELIAIREAATALGGWRLPETTLYVTLEPCAMCAGAIAHARLRRVYYGAEDPKAGAVDNGVRLFAQPTCHHRPEVISGIGEGRAAELLQAFFRDRR